MKKLLALCILLCTAFSFVCAQDLTPEEQRTVFIEQCKAYLGTPYKYGGISKTGMDCSGLIFTSAKQSLGIKLPRRAEDLYNATERLEKDQLQPGDFLFFKAANTVNHAAVYLGDDEFIHAASDGPKTGVIISKMSDSYWNTTFVGCGKFLPAATHPERIGKSFPKKEEAEAVQVETPVKAEPEVLPVAVAVVPEEPEKAEEPETGFVQVEAVPAGTENQGEVFTAIPVPGTISAGPSAEEIAAQKQKEQLAAQEAALAQAQAQAEEQARALAEAQAQLKAAQDAQAQAEAQAAAYAKAQAEAQAQAYAKAQAEAQAQALAQAQAQMQANQAAQINAQNQQSMAMQEATQAAREAAAAAREATLAAKEATAAAQEAKAAANEATQASKEALKVADTSYRSILSFPDVTISTDGFIY